MDTTWDKHIGRSSHLLPRRFHSNDISQECRGVDLKQKTRNSLSSNFNGSLHFTCSSRVFLILSDYYSSIATRILKLKHPPALKALAKGTCEGWPNGFASRKFHAYNWLMRFYNNLCRLALGGQTVKDLRPNFSSTKANAGYASRCKSTQVGGQTKRKLNASPKLASTC